jgi:hypothetical protein
MVTDGEFKPDQLPTYRLPRWKRVTFILIVIVLMIGMAEVGARAVDAFTGISVQEHRKRYKYRRMCRLESMWYAQRGDYPYLPYVPNPRDRRVNSLGFRGAEISAEKPSDVYRIFCMGGSTTWDEYPSILERELLDDFAARGLKLEVINGGNVSWTTMESLINLIARGLPLKPDAIVVYHAVNDAVPAFGPNHSPDYSHWRGRLEKSEPLIWDHLPTFLDHSAAYVGLRALFERRVPTLGWTEMVVRYAGDRDEYPYHGMEPFRQNIYSITSLARARGIEVFLCTQVFNYDYEFKYSLDRYGRAVKEANDITRSFAGRWPDVHLIDVAGSLPGSNDWMTDICHFTSEGKVKLARFIADGIRPHLAELAARQGDPWDVPGLLPERRPSLADGSTPDSVPGPGAPAG